jgi:transcriptional regulator with XRE-family HTH domain
MTPTQCKMARVALDWTLQDLANAAQVGLATVNRFEIQQAVPRRATLAAIQRAFEAAGVRFTEHGVELPPLAENEPRPALSSQDDREIVELADVAGEPKQTLVRSGRRRKA